MATLLLAFNFGWAGAQNTAPTIAPVATQTTCDFVAKQVILTVTDANSDPVTVTATSSNQTLVPNGNISYNAGTLTITPATGQVGEATITLTPNDGTVNGNAVSFVLGVGTGVAGIEQLYIPNFFGGTVSVVNASTNAITQTITVGSSPYGVAVSPNGSKAYITNGGSNNVSVINTADNTVSATVSVGTAPRGVSVSPDGTKVYVTNRTSNTVTVINTADNTINATINVGTDPRAVAVGSDGSKVYVSNFGSNNVMVINTADNSINATVSVGVNPFGIAVTPDGTKAYVANYTSNTVSVINTANNTIITTVNVGSLPNNVSVSPDGSKVYVANNMSNTVSVINTTTNTVVSTLIVSGNPIGISLSSDGSKLYTTGSSTNNLLVVNPTANTISATISGFNGLYAVGNFVKAGGTIYSSCNTAPTIAAVATQSTCDYVAKQVTLTVADADSDPITVSASSSNQTLVPNGNITYNAGTLTITPATGQVGEATVTLTPNDGKVNGDAVSFKLEVGTKKGNGNGTTWTSRTSAAINVWYSITYGNGLFVAVSVSGTNRVMTSPDGITWTARTAAAANQWTSVTYGNGMFVAVSADGTNQVMTSPDGIIWTARTAVAANNWYAVTYGNGLFVAVSGNGTNRVMTSPDGITWTARTAAEANQWRSVTYGNGFFVAVSGDGTNRVMTSPDGITWTARAAAAANFWYSVTYGNGVYVAISLDGTNLVMTSPDGITWTSRTAANANTWMSVTYGNGVFVAVSENGSNRVMTSPDGSTWTAQTAAGNNSWYAVTYGNGFFVAVSGNGTNQVMTSGDATYTSCNTAPTIAAVATQSTCDGVAKQVTLTVSDVDSDPVTLSATSSNQTFVPNGNITYNAGTLTITPATGQVGEATITLTPNDGKVNGDAVSFKLEVGNKMGNPDILYIPNFASNSVSVINTATNTVTADISVGDMPYGVSVSPDGSRIYVTNFGANSVSVINAATNTVSTTISVGDSPYGILVSPNGKAYVANRMGNSVSVINTTTNTVVSTIAVVSKPVGFAASPDGGKVYVVNQFGNAISVINTATNTVESTITGSEQQHGIAISPDGSKIYVGNQAANTVSVISTATNTVSNTIAVGIAPFAVSISPNGSTLYVSNETGNSVSVINTATNTVVSTIAVGSSPRGVSVASNGNKVYVCNSNDNTISVINTATNTVESTITGLSLPASVGNFVTGGTTYTACNIAPTIASVATQSTCDNEPSQVTLTVSDADSDPVTVSATSSNTTLVPNGNITYNAGTLTITPAADQVGEATITLTPNDGTVAGDAVSFVLEVGNKTGTAGDGATWTSRTSAANNQWSAVTYGNGLFVAVAGTGAGNRVMTSSDGITWDSQTSAASDHTWLSVTYGNGLFVAVSDDGIGNDRVMTSPDGITWTNQTSAANNSWRSVTYGNGLFVAVAGSGTGNRVMTSPNGINWTIQTSAADNFWHSVTYGNGLFVAVAVTGSGNRAMTSPNGINWTIRNSAANNEWRSVTYGNGLFVAVSDNGSGNRVMTSPDGINWTSQTSATDNNWNSVTYGNGFFVAVGNSGTGNRVMTSPDGINWTSKTSATDNGWTSVTYGNGFFVAVSTDGTSNRVMTSGDLIYTPCNFSPTIGSITDKVTCENSSTEFTFSVSDADFDDVQVTASSNNLTLLPASGIKVSPAMGAYNAAPRTLTLTPAAGQSGTVQVMVLATDARNGTDTVYFTLTVNTLPTQVSLSYIAPVCENMPDFTLTQGSPAGGVYTINNEVATSFSPGNLGAGSHQVVYSVESEASCAASVSQMVTVKAVTIPTLAEFDAICLNSEALTLSGGQPSGGTYSGEGVIGGKFNPTTVGVSQENTITYTYTNSSNCSASVSGNIEVLAIPVAEVDNLKPVCLNDEELNLINQTELTGTYSGKGVENNMFSPADAGVGTHEIDVLVTAENGCSNTGNFEITVKDIPAVSIGKIANMCTNDALVALTGSPQGGTFTGNGVVSGNFNPNLAGTGEHTITYSFTAENGCNNEATTTTIIHELPEPSIQASATSMCQGESATLSTGNFNSYQWFSGEQAIIDATSASFETSTSGTYSVLVSNEYCSQVSNNIEITVHELPEPAVQFSGIPNFCVDSDILLETDQYVSYQWNLNGQLISNATEISYSASQSGNYSVTVFDGICYGTSTAVAVSGSSPIAISGDRTPVLCTGETITFTASPAVSYQWFNSNGKITNATNQTFATGMAGSYWVVATDNSGCIATSVAIAVTVHALPTPTISVVGETEFCFGESTQLITDTNETYRWKKDGITIAGASFQNVAVAMSGNYKVEVSDENGCKNSSSSVTITVNPLPNVAINHAGVNSICENENLELEIAPDAASYQWYQGGVAISNTNQNIFSANQAGSYRVTAVSAQGCENTSAAAIVFVLPSPATPVIEFTGTSLISSYGDSYQWYQNGTEINQANAQELLLTANGIYSVMVSSANGCQTLSDDYAVTNLAIETSLGTINISVFPNPFKESFTISISTSTSGNYQLFDMNGKLVSSNKLVTGANTINSSELAQGVYQLSLQIDGQANKVIKLIK